LASDIEYGKERFMVALQAAVMVKTAESAATVRIVLLMRGLV